MATVDRAPNPPAATVDSATQRRLSRRPPSLGRSRMAAMMLTRLMRMLVRVTAGGFTALCMVASDEFFAAGASRFGIADLETFRQQAPKFQAHELDRLVGLYPEAAATYRARSPLHTVDRIARPVLLVHGLEDTVVPPSQAQVMAEALARRGVRHVLLAFPGEGHGFRHPESIRRALEAELSFYVEALGLAPGKPGAPPTADGAI